MDILHDAFQLLVYFFGAPTQFDGVLSHFQTRYRYTAGVGRLTRSIQNLGFLEYFDGFGSRRHVGAFGYRHYTVGDKFSGIVTVDFILSGGRQGNIRFFTPGTCAFYVFNARILLCIFADTSTVEVLQLHDVIQFFTVDTCGVVYVTVGVGHR